jgi:hypothetical protein
MQKGGTPGGHHASATADGPKYDTSYQPHGRSTGVPSRRGTSSSAGSSSRRGTTPHSSGRHELYVIAVNGTRVRALDGLFEPRRLPPFAENRMKEVGLAIMDLRRPELLLTQFTDSKSYSFTTSKLVRPTSLLRPNIAHPGYLPQATYAPVEVYAPSIECRSSA